MNEPFLLELGDATVACFANYLFQLGMKDGREKTKPRDSLDVMVHLRSQFPKAFRMRVVDRKKMRQVYGAGYDMTRAEALVPK